MKELPTRYDPQQSEERIYGSWLKEGLFHADEKSSGKSYCIVIPPPNVTGVLHMGHALNNTIQDILVRWKRMRGYNALWMPGTDHAGIATQNVVEKELAKEGLKRREVGREKFLEKVWEWKEEYGSTIIRQLKRLGCSCDWDRTRFTMDEGLSNAVKEVFVRLYGEGLVYKGDYIINWCPRCSTALSDEEAEHRDVEGMLYYIKYPVKGRQKLENENEDYVVVATTRPETMLGDVAVAVNPKDKRYSFLKGNKLILPLIGRELDVIFDREVDPAFGTGALKVTPAHDPVDFELGRRHALESINVMHPDGRINTLGGEYEGMDRFECRETIIEDLKDRNLFIRAEKHLHAVGHCYRCHTVVEPRLSKQWFVKMKPLAKPGIKAVEEGEIKFHPARWTKVYLNWMGNIRDWCISRQIWWGHRIPVWYCKDCLGTEEIRDVEIDAPEKKGVYVGTVSPEKCPSCGGTHLEQDPDVLDTWFSSWLWPFSTLGWPGHTEELEKFYPTDALVTAQEIIFFWVARMIMSGLKFLKAVPFRDVYIHGTVRDSSGTKMSKSLGNVIDPLDVIKEVGSDALRFSIISITSQGQDVFLSKEKFEIGRNFANKLWNASRYVLMNVASPVPEGDIDAKELTLADRWILDQFDRTIAEADKSLTAYRFNDAAGVLYDFIWHKYCDWYLEISKSSENTETVHKVLIKVLKGSLQLLHPIMPFITEEIWQSLPGANEKWIMTSVWPRTDKRFRNKKASSDMDKLVEVITSVRNIRAFWNIAHTANVNISLEIRDDEDKRLLNENSGYVEKLGKCRIRDAQSAGADLKTRRVEKLAGGIKVSVYLEESMIDVEREKERVSKKMKEIDKYLTSLTGKLKNKKFIENAPKDVVEKERGKQKKWEEERDFLGKNLDALK